MEVSFIRYVALIALICIRKIIIICSSQIQFYFNINKTLKIKNLIENKQNCMHIEIDKKNNQ